MASSKEDFKAAIIKAHKAGDTAGAEKLANAYKSRFSAQPPQEEEGGKLESAALGAVQGASMGFADEVVAAKNAIGDVIADNAIAVIEDGLDGLDKTPTIGQRYEEHLQSERDMYDAAEKRNPITFAAGDIAGSLLTTVGTGGTSLVSKFALGATTGLMHGAGRSEDDTIEGVMMDAATGAAFGIAGEGLGALGGKIISKGAEKIQKAQGKHLIKYLGDQYASVEKNLNKVGKPVRDWAERVVGYTDEAGESLVSVRASREEMLETFDMARKKAGNDMGAILDEVDGMGVRYDATSMYNDLMDNNVIPLKDTMDPDQMQIARKMKDFLKKAFYQSSDIVEEVSQKAGIKQTRKLIPHESISLRKLNELKNRIYSDAKHMYKMEDPLKIRELKAKLGVANRLGQQIDEVIETSSELSGKPLLSKYKEARTRYGDLKESVTAINNRMKRDNGKDFITHLFNGAMSRRNIAAEVIGATAGLPIGSTAATITGIQSIANSPMVNAVLAKSMGRMANAMKGNPQSYSRLAKNLAIAATVSSDQFTDVLFQGAAEVDLKESPVLRTTEEAIRRKDSILLLLSQKDPKQAETLRTAFENRDSAMINGMMAQMAESDLNGYFIKGIGWNNKAVTKNDIAKVESFLKSVPSTRERRKLTKSFRETGNIPLEMFQPKEESMKRFVHMKRSNKVNNPEY